LETLDLAPIAGRAIWHSQAQIRALCRGTRLRYLILKGPAGHMVRGEEIQGG
jgi:hypothetical protein